MDASEVAALRDFLNGVNPAPASPPPASDAVAGQGDRLREAFDYVAGLLPGGIGAIERESDTYVLTCMVNVGELKKVRAFKAALRNQPGEASQTDDGGEGRS